MVKSPKSVIITAIFDWHLHIRPSKTAITPDNITTKNCCQTSHSAYAPAITREIAPSDNARLNLRGWNVALAGDHGLGQIQKAGFARVIGKRQRPDTQPISVPTTPFLPVDPY